MELGALIAAIVACLLVQAFFAASEIAMVVTDESKLAPPTSATDANPRCCSRCCAAAIACSP